MDEDINVPNIPSEQDWRTKYSGETTTTEVIPPTIKAELFEQDDWDNWAQSIEIKLNRDGKMIVGLVVGLGITLVLVTLQGSVVINLAKATRSIGAGLNDVVNLLNGGANNSGSSSVSYANPTGKVDETKAAPIDTEELDELKERMEGADDPTKKLFGED